MEQGALRGVTGDASSSAPCTTAYALDFRPSWCNESDTKRVGLFHVALTTPDAPRSLVGMRVPVLERKNIYAKTIRHTREVRHRSCCPLPVPRDGRPTLLADTAAYSEPHLYSALEAGKTTARVHTIYTSEVEPSYIRLGVSLH